VEGYRREFGNERSYINVPYFSNLDPFLALHRVFAEGRPVRFLFSGAFVERKGIDLLASAFRRLLQSGVEAELHLMGGGPLEKPVAAQLSPVRAHVHFHGFKQWSQLAEIYALGDVLCVPSRYDGWGLVVAEGLASAMPVISTDRTGSALDLLASSNGWLVPAGDGDALLAAMRSAATMTVETRHEMGRAARQAAMLHSLASGAERFSQAIELSLKAWNG
jgi:glycosyltransferase involved in cell wall biosynthesis